MKPLLGNKGCSRCESGFLEGTKSQTCLDTSHLRGSEWRCSDMSGFPDFYYSPCHGRRSRAARASLDYALLLSRGDDSLDRVLVEEY